MAETLKNKSIWKIVDTPYWPALLSGLIVPGLGQISNKEYRKGILLLVFSLGTLFWFSRLMTSQLSLLLPGSPQQWQQNENAFREAVLSMVQQDPLLFLTFHALMVTLWLFGILDAFLSAKKIKLQSAQPKKNENTDR